MEQLTGKLSIEPILELIKSSNPYAYVEGIRVKVGGVRLETFANKGVKCVSCPLEGTFFRVEDNTSGPHLNLYAINPFGSEVLMTRDHIIPHSLGGPNHIDNMNTMCTHCNGRRGVTPLEDFLSTCKGVYKPNLTDMEDMRNHISRYIENNGTDNTLIKILSGDVSSNRLWKIVAVQEELNRAGDKVACDILENFKISSKNVEVRYLNGYVQSIR